MQHGATLTHAPHSWGPNTCGRFGNDLRQKAGKSDYHVMLEIDRNDEESLSIHPQNTVTNCHFLFTLFAHVTHNLVPKRHETKVYLANSKAQAKTTMSLRQRRSFGLAKYCLALSTLEIQRSSKNAMGTTMKNKWSCSALKVWSIMVIHEWLMYILCISRVWTCLDVSTAVRSNVRKEPLTSTCVHDMQDHLHEQISLNETSPAS